MSQLKAILDEQNKGVQLGLIEKNPDLAQNVMDATWSPKYPQLFEYFMAEKKDKNPKPR